MNSSSKKSPQLRISTSQRITMKTKLAKKPQNSFRLKPNLKLYSVAIISPNSSIGSDPNSTKNRSLEVLSLKSKGPILQKASASFISSHKFIFAEKDVYNEIMLELTDFEKDEIKFYSEILYAGKNRIKLNRILWEEILILILKEGITGFSKEII